MSISVPYGLKITWGVYLDDLERYYRHLYPFLPQKWLFLVKIIKNGQKSPFLKAKMGQNAYKWVHIALNRRDTPLR